MPLLYAITDENLIPKGRLLKAVESAILGGADIIQLRDKTTPDSELLPLAMELMALCDEHRVPLIINDRLEIAAELSAGLHLGDEDVPVAVARRELGPDAIIGRSCHDSIALALEAREQGASYVAFGPIFPTPTKPGRPGIGLSILDEAKQTLDFPFAAIGGIDVRNIRDVAGKNPWAICVIRAIFAQPDPKEAAARLRELMAPDSLKTEIQP
ncbi:MAG: thiamine phosphate synthase [candidate division WOR-3 bacterium]